MPSPRPPRMDTLRHYRMMISVLTSSSRKVALETKSRHLRTHVDCWGFHRLTFAQYTDLSVLFDLGPSNPVGHLKGPSRAVHSVAVDPHLKLSLRRCELLALSPNRRCSLMCPPLDDLRGVTCQMKFSGVDKSTVWLECQIECMCSHLAMTCPLSAVAETASNSFFAPVSRLRESSVS